MKRTVNNNEFEKLSSAELLDLVSNEFHAATKETLATVNLQLETAHKCDPDNEELEFSLIGIHQLLEKFDEHVGKEEQLIFPLFSVNRKKNATSNDAKEVAGFINELIEEHRWMKNKFSLLRKATNEYQCSIDSFPSQKLAYAQMNNLEQDFNRIFFVEEEYLFPRILRQLNK